MTAVGSPWDHHDTMKRSSFSFFTFPKAQRTAIALRR